MPMLLHCHECDQPTGNRIGICSNCIEQSNADENKYFDKDGVVPDWRKITIKNKKRKSK